MEKKKLLIFPAGTEIAFEILNALKYSKFVEIYGGTSADDHAEFVYKKLIKGFPYINDPGFLAFLNRVIDENRIECIYPAHDSASVFFSEHQAEIHAQVIIAEPFTTTVCRSKAETYRYLSEFSFIPTTYSSPEEVEQYPVFVKPSIGQGSNGARKIENRRELKEALEADRELVICEYLPGMEYTSDCFTDRNGNLLVCKFRDRERIRSGIAVRSRSLECPAEVARIAEELNTRFHFKGAWFFQVKLDSSGHYKLLEISPRIPGTMGLSRNSGINFPMLTLFVFWGYDVSVIENCYDIMLDRAFYSAYRVGIEYDHIYLDFDDTVTLDDTVNPEVMRFIYQAVNRGKQIHLLSRHAGDLIQDLHRLHIDRGLFAEVIVLAGEEEKWEYIQEKKAIFIDDSFAERKKVKEKTGVPVFDVDMIESLIDWRM